MSDSTITLVVLGVAAVLFVSNRIPPDAVAFSAALALTLTGVISVGDAFSGFGDPAVIFIAGLFVVGAALDSSGLTVWAGGRLVSSTGGSVKLTVVSMLGFVALFSAFVTPNAAVAALVPMVSIIAIRLKLAASKLLVPLVFAAHAGALLLLIGSPVNILIGEAIAGTGNGDPRFFEFAIVGLPLVIGTIAISMLLAPRLLPERTPDLITPDLSELAQTLAAEYRLDDDDLVRHGVAPQLFTRQSGVAEVIVPPRSPLIGQHVFPGMTSPSGDLVVVAVRRNGRDTEAGETELRSGDSMLVEGSWDALADRIEPPELMSVEEPLEVRRQAVPFAHGAKRSVAVLVLMVTTISTGLLEPAVAGALAALAIVLTGVFSTEQAYRAISWQTIVLVASMLPVSGAIRTTGAGDDIANALVDVVGTNPHLLLIGLFVVSAGLGQVISNTATALIMIPVAISAADNLDVSSKPVLMSLLVASTAAFITPIASPPNMMVLEPGGYRFGDFWRLGLVTMLLFFVVAVFLVPAVWPFR